VSALGQLGDWFETAFSDMGKWIDWAGTKFNDFVAGAANFAGLVVGKIRFMAGAVAEVFRALGKMISDFWNNLVTAVSKFADIDLSDPLAAIAAFKEAGVGALDAVTTMPEFTVDFAAARAAGEATGAAVSEGVRSAYTASRTAVVRAVTAPFIAGSGMVGDVIDQMSSNAAARIAIIKAEAVSITQEMERNRPRCRDGRAPG
jgi:phage-related protein